MVLIFLGCVVDKDPHRDGSGEGEQGEGALGLRVVLDDGTPLVGAEVEVADESRVTDIEGHVEITSVTPGEVDIRARADGASPGHDTVTVEDGARTEAVVVLRALRHTTLPDA